MTMREEVNSGFNFSISYVSFKSILVVGTVRKKCIFKRYNCSHSFTQQGKNVFLKDMVLDENGLSVDDAADLRE